MGFKIDISRREFLRMSALLTGAAVAGGAFSTTTRAQDDQAVRIGYLPITDSAPLLIAHANKLFELASIFLNFDN